MLNSYLTEIMLLAGLGALLDNVFITDNERDQISAYLDGGAEDLSLTQRFSNFLARAHSIIFGRFFAAKLFSWGFLLSAATISIVSFSAVLGLQIYLFPEQFAQLTLNSTQIGLFTAFILFNIVFDYATIIQTKIFIEASLSARSIFRALVFIAADLIVTMNTFILSYAFFILLVVQTFVSPPEPATIILSDSRAVIEIDPEEERRFLRGFEGQEFTKKLRFWGNAGGALFGEGDEENPELAVVYYYATFDPRAAETQAYLLTSVTNLNLSHLNISVVVGDEDYTKYLAILEGVNSDLQRQLGGEDQQETRLVKLDFEIDGSVFRDGSLTAAYTASFQLTDQLEDGFPASVAGPMELPRLSTLIENSVASQILDHPTVVCFGAGLPTKRFRLSGQTVELLEGCSDFAIVELFWASALDKDLALIGRETSGYRVPFNTLLITSILPTAFFYLVIVLLAIATVCFSKLIKGTNRVKKFFLRAPLAISGCILGAFLSLVGAI